MTERELMQQALDALITAELDGNCEYGVTDSLRARLAQCDAGEICIGCRVCPDAQPEPPCKTGSQCIGGKCERCAVPEGCAECGKQASDGWALYCVKCSEPVQEPIGWIYEDDEGRMMFSQMPHHDPLWEPVYRAKRKWVGLTDEEINDHWINAMWNTEGTRLPIPEFARAIEAKLKEKNT